MERFRITGDWLYQSRQLKSQFSVLTDSDLHFERGKEGELLERIGCRLHKTREEVILLIKAGLAIKSL